MSVAMVGSTVLREVPEREEEMELLWAARAEALATVMELHGVGGLSAAAADVRERPDYWLGRLEGVVLGLVAAVDLALGEAGEPHITA